MNRRILDFVLLAAAVIGGIMAWQTARERTRLKGDYDRLAAVAGDLPVADPSKVAMKALKTGTPLLFAWRVYTPPGYRGVISNNAGGLGTTTHTQSAEFIARAGIRETDDGKLESYTSFLGGSTRFGLGDPSLVKFLHGRWDKIQVEQLGADGITTLEPDQYAVLLRLSMPKEMEAEARKTLEPHLLERCVPILFEFRLGKKPASNP